MSKIANSRKVKEVIQRIYERENKIKTKLSNLRLAKHYEEVKDCRSKPQISKKSQQIIEKKKKGWMPIYQPERINQIQKSHERVIRGITERVQQERQQKELLEEQELQKQYQNLKKMPLDHFESKYTQQMEDYQQKLKMREEQKTKRSMEQCTFTPMTNHVIKNNKKKQLKQNQKEANKTINVVERMENYQKWRDNKLEMKKRELTPKFKPKVLENYNSARKGSRNRTLKESKSHNLLKQESAQPQSNVFSNRFSSRGSVRSSKNSIPKGPVRASISTADEVTSEIIPCKAEFKSMKTTSESMGMSRLSRQTHKSQAEVTHSEIDITDWWHENKKFSLGNIKKCNDLGNMFQKTKEETILEENFMSPTFMLYEEKKQTGKH